MEATDIEREFLCGGCAACFSSFQALQHHWYQKTLHRGKVIERVKRRCAESVLEHRAEQPVLTIDNQRLTWSGCSPSTILPTIANEILRVSKDYDRVELECGRYDPGKELSRTAKAFLPIIAKQSRDDFKVLVKELYQSKLIPWANYEETMQTLNYALKTNNIKNLPQHNVDSE